MTPKREKFCRLYVETGNASEAYRGAFDCGRMRPETVHKRASELLAHGEVAGRISELQAAHRARHDITVDTITAQLLEDRRLAHATLNAGAAVSASMSLAKLHGLLPNRLELTGAGGGPIDVKFVEEFETAAKKAREHAAKLTVIDGGRAA